MNHLEPDFLEPNHLVLIGSSTGGPGHLHKILHELPVNFMATIIIAQHIAKEFIPSFVKQLRNASKIEVAAVTDGLTVMASTIYVCSDETTLNYDANRLIFNQHSSLKARYNPDIDILFHSAAQLPHRFKMMGIILTGIGDDGSEGIKQMALQGASCIAESETTSIVYGMPLHAKLKVKDITVAPLPKIITTIKKFGDNHV